VYRVVWEIDVEDAESPEEAAERALCTMQERDSIATVFTVIDLDTNETRVVDLGYREDA